MPTSVQDPWEQAAKDYQGNSSAQVHAGTSEGNESPSSPQYSGVSEPPNENIEVSPDQALWDAKDPEQERFSTQLIKDVPNFIGNQLVGGMKGAGSTLSTGLRLVEHIPGVSSLVPKGIQYGVDHPEIYNPEENEKFGYGTEQVGEFLLPTGMEEGAARLGASALARFGPRLLKTGEIAGRALGAAGHNAALNSLQGGSPTIGALSGAGGSLVGKGTKAAAPYLMDFAQSVKNGLPNAGTGKAMLEETSSIFPSVARRQAGERTGELNRELTNVFQRASEQPTNGPGLPNKIISLGPARTLANDQLQKEAAQNSPLLSTAQRLRGQLYERPLIDQATGEVRGYVPREEMVTPNEAREIRQGIGKVGPQTSWSPRSEAYVKSMRDPIYGQVTGAIHEAVPETVPLDARLHALIPGSNLPAAPLFFRYASPAGGALIGGYEGYRHGGAEGALKGAGEGLLLGAALHPSLNAGARIMYHPEKFLLPATTGSLLQLNREDNQ